MMTSKSDPRGHPGLKLCVHVSVMGYYRLINFHQNRRGSGIFLGDFTWNDPYVWAQVYPSSGFPIILVRKPCSLLLPTTYIHSSLDQGITGKA